MPRDNVVDSFVVEQNGVITDFGSFYHLPSTIMNHPQHKVLKAAYSFYNVATKTPLNDLMNDMLITAKNVKKNCEISIKTCPNLSLFYRNKSLILTCLMRSMWWRIQSFWKHSNLALATEICNIISIIGNVQILSLKK